jgi:hypothetical protein
MKFETPNPAPPFQRHGSLLVLAALALLVGTAAGAVGALFRLALEHADQWRNDLITWAQNEGPTGFLLVVMICTVDSNGSQSEKIRQKGERKKAQEKVLGHDGIGTENDAQGCSEDRDLN